MNSVHQETLTVSEYAVLLLINAADCDFEIHKKEIEYITSRYNEDVYLKMKTYYDKHKTESFSLLIKELKVNPNLAKEKNSMMKEVYEILQSDGVYNDFEKSYYNFFKEI